MSPDFPYAINYTRRPLSPPNCTKCNQRATIPSGKGVGRGRNILTVIMLQKSARRLQTCRDISDTLFSSLLTGHCVFFLCNRSWDTTTMMTSSIKLYPHPCFVYAAQYHPGSPHIVVTGGYDHYLRVWTKLNEGLNGKVRKTACSLY